MVRTFTALFPIEQTRSVEELSDVVRRWIAGSSYRNVDNSELEGIDKDEFEYSGNNPRGTIQVSTVRYTEQATDNLAIRLLERDGSKTHVTDVAGRKNGKDFKVAVSHNFVTSELGESIQQGSKPRIISDIIQKLGGGFDGNFLKVQQTPYWLDNSDLQAVADIMTNTSKNSLPVVYLSLDNRGYTAIHPERVAKELAGMAHVLVEPSRDFSFALKGASRSRNIFNGAVGMYWPNGHREYMMPHRVRDIDYYLFEAIREAGLYVGLDNVLTFDGIKSLLVTKKIDELKSKQGATQEQISASQEQALNLAIDEIDRRDKELVDLRERVNYLTHRLGQSASASEEGPLKLPQVAELYDGEARDMIIEGIRNYVANTHDGSRRRQIIEAFLGINEPSDEGDRISEEVKILFKQSPDFKGRLKKDLENLGFGVDQTGKHPKLFVPGNENTFYTLPSSPSDIKSGKATYAGIRHKLL